MANIDKPTTTNNETKEGERMATLKAIKINIL